MALGDPLQILLALVAVVAIPVVILYWVVRLAVRSEMRRRTPNQASGQWS